MDKDTAKEILNEITTFCGVHCSSVNCCPEDECILFRIEQLAIKEFPNDNYKYEMPKEIKDKLTNEVLSDFPNKFIDVFNLEQNSILTYYGDMAYSEGTHGWQIAFDYACEKHGLNDVIEYVDSLEWYDYDLFCGEVSDLLLEYGIIEEGEQYCEELNDELD